ncbi:MAG: autotransporter outer membrane beta-barrel domain-containing protein, partial [Deltaproteobacteria bacterium]|nr:autotransporter outer membrane beta-barrel domain-containing protein [Deltaproteobacteria bacterium]
FNDATSSRLRLGARIGFAVNDYVRPYIGAAWEREFNGESRAVINGFAVDAPSLGGSTGVGEIGLSLTPSLNFPMSFDLGVQGYTGKREGVTGSLQIKFDF